MKEYYLDLAGMHILLRTPYEIAVSDNLRPFLCQPQKNTGCSIIVQSCDRLPLPSREGIWNGPEYYDSYQGVMRIFHCKAPGMAAFAVTQLLENGNVELSVLPDYLSYFAGSEGIFNRIGLETLLLRHNGLLLHASLIKFENKAIAFAGPSGTGKSTHAALWQQHLGATLLNGDRAVLRIGDQGITAYGSPYAGTSGIYKNDYAPLAAIVVLQQAKENNLRQLTRTEAFRYLFPEFTIHRWDKEFAAQATDLCLQLLTQTPVYLLECLPEASAALLVKKGLNL